MNLKNLLIITGVLLLVFKMKNKKPKKASKKMNKKIIPSDNEAVRNYTLDDAKEALYKIREKYGREMARIIERIYRLETGHFKSLQYRKTGSAGMEVGKWKGLPLEKMAGTVTYSDADKSDGDDTFHVWKDVYSPMEYLAEYIKRWGGNWARWHGTTAERQQKYKKSISQIKNRIII